MNRGMNNVWSLVAASAIVYGLLAIVMGVIPGVVMSNTPPTEGLKPFTAAQARGREIYVSEGCAYCHTQNVRPLNKTSSSGVRQLRAITRTRLPSCSAIIATGLISRISAAANQARPGNTFIFGSRARSFTTRSCRGIRGSST